MLQLIPPGPYCTWAAAASLAALWSHCDTAQVTAGKKANWTVFGYRLLEEQGIKWIRKSPAAGFDGFILTQMTGSILVWSWTEISMSVFEYSPLLYTQDSLNFHDLPVFSYNVSYKSLCLTRTSRE